MTEDAAGLRKNGIVDDAGDENKRLVGVCVGLGGVGAGLEDLEPLGVGAWF